VVGRIPKRAGNAVAALHRPPEPTDIPAGALYGFSTPLDSHNPVSDALFCAGAWNDDPALTSICYDRMGRCW
jgi:hypothetical protein